MKPELFIAALWGQGFEVNLGPEDSIVVTPGSRLHETQRDMLRANKPAIVAYLQANPPAGDVLLAMAMEACDLYGDCEQARADMRADCLATPPHLRADLLDHFTALQKLHSSSASYHSGYQAGYHQNGDDQVVTTSTTATATAKSNVRSATTPR